MKYNLANEKEHKEASIYFAQLVATDSIVEIKKVSPKRTLNQNSYLHLIIGAFGNHFGYTLDEAKLIYKELNSDIYGYEKKNRYFWRSSADLSKEEMAQSIDHFMKISAANGCELPLATDVDWLRRIENEIERNRYLR